jgi:Ribonuclease G/E
VKIILQVLHTRSNTCGVSKKISGPERKRLKEIVTKMRMPLGFSLTVRTAAEGHSLEDLQKDLDGLLLTWNEITERAKSAALAADDGNGGAVPVMLHCAMGQTLSVVEDFFNKKVIGFVFVVLILFCQPGVIRIETGNHLCLAWIYVNILKI